jgi:hypothetical protein
MRRMKACALVNLSGATAVVLLSAFACGGSKAAAPPAETAEAPAAASADAPLVPSGPDAPPQAETSTSAAAAPAASAKGGDDDGPETRTMDVIANIIKTHRQEARTCYETALKKIPGLKGDLVIHFMLTPAGKVKTAEVNTERSTLQNEMTAKCVMDVIKSIHFPESSKGMESNVNYPFNFNP